MEMDDDELWTVRQAAKFLGVSGRTVWTWSTPRGTLPCRKIGTRVVRYSRNELRAWSAEHQIPANESMNKQ